MQDTGLGSGFRVFLREVQQLIERLSRRLHLHEECVEGDGPLESSRASSRRKEAARGDDAAGHRDELERDLGVDAYDGHGEKARFDNGDERPG